MIKRSHTHPEQGKVCYEVHHLNGHHLDEPQLVFFPAAEPCTIAYMPYTGLWYAWNEEGKEMSSFSREFYDRFITRLPRNSLAPDPDCKP